MLFMFLLAQDAEESITGVPADSSLFGEMLEKGGLPALAIVICFLIFVAILKSKAKQDKAMTEHLSHMTAAYEKLVHRFIDLTEDSTRAITILCERLGGGPVYGPPRPQEEDDND